MKNLKIFYACLLCLFLMSTSQLSFAQNKFCPAPPPLGDINDFVGDWTGNYTHEGKSHELKVNLKVEDDELIATTMLPEFKILLTEFKTRICFSNEIHFSHTLPNEKVVEFFGRPQEDTFSGKFRIKEGNVCTRITDHFLLTRKRPLATNRKE